MISLALNFLCLLMRFDSQYCLTNLPVALLSERRHLPSVDVPVILDVDEYCDILYWTWQMRSSFILQARLLANQPRT